MVETAIKDAISAINDRDQTIAALKAENERLRADLAQAAPDVKALRDAAKSVEEWWLSEGMKHFIGAPYAMFALRSALATPVAPEPTSGAWNGTVGEGWHDASVKRPEADPTPVDTDTPRVFEDAIAEYATPEPAPDVVEASPEVIVPNWFVTCVAGDGDPYVKVAFKTLPEAQDFHGRLMTGRLPSALSHAQAGWRSMDSAPKDGTRILAYNGEGVDFFHWQSRGPRVGWRDSFITVYPEDHEAGPKGWQPIPSAPGGQ